MTSDFCLIMTTLPNEESANQLAYQLIEQQLAGCVNIIKPGISSIYRWQGQIITETEYLMLIKSSWINYAKLELAIQASHPYQVPEIIAIPIEQGAASYLTWLAVNTSPIK